MYLLPLLNLLYVKLNYKLENRDYMRIEIKL